MAFPTSRATFRDYCLRRLGWPVININVDDDQVEERIDDALQYYWDYHFDGSEKVYYKHQITSNNMHTAVYGLTLVEGGTLYSNSDVVVFSGGGGANAAASITTYANGTISAVSLTDNGIGFATVPTISITTSTGSGAEITAELGGWIPIPENIIGVVNIFNGGSAFGISDMFNVQYQLAINDMYNYTNFTLIPYYITRTHLELINQLLNGQKPIRYNRHRNRCYVDMKWDTIPVGHWLIVEAYNIVDPDEWTDAWNDRWLKQYSTALIKRQWGNNMKKYSGVQLVNGVQMNGQVIYEEAEQEIAKLEGEMINSYSLPACDMIG